MPRRSNSPLEKVLSRADQIVGIHREGVKTQGRPAELYSDVLRSAVVMMMSALDAHVTDAITGAVGEVVKAGHVGDQLVDWVKEDPRETLGWLASPDPLQALEDASRERLGRSTYQHPGKIEGALRDTIGAELDWTGIFLEVSARRRSIRTEKEARDRLAKLALRRNQIAHEGDLIGSRTRPIRRDYVEVSIDLVRAVGSGVEAAVTTRLRTL